MFFTISADIFDGFSLKIFERENAILDEMSACSLSMSISRRRSSSCGAV